MVWDSSTDGIIKLVFDMEKLVYTPHVFIFNLCLFINLFM